MAVASTRALPVLLATLAGILTAVVLLAVSLLGSPPTAGAFTTSAAGSLGLTSEQLDQARRALTIADEEHAPGLPVLAEMVAALGESELAPVPNAQGSGFCGVFQADPKNIACDDTEQQARSFLRGGLGFQAGGAIAYAHDHPSASPGTIAYHVEGDRSNFSSDAAAAWFYDKHRPQGERIIAAWRAGAGAFPTGAAIPVGMTAKEIIDTIVLPICNQVGITLTPAQVDAANARHGPTKTGGRSDHQGPPDIAWAADMSNGYATPQEDALAAALAQRFHIPWTGSGLVTVTPPGYRFQLIYRTYEGGDHFTHVHFGVRVG